MGVEDTSYLVDWITLTSTQTERHLAWCLHELDNGQAWRECKGNYGYAKSLSNGVVRVYYEGNDTVCLVFKGKGCRKLESLLKIDSEPKWQAVINKWSKEGWKCTRIDFAFDTHSSDLTLDFLTEKVKSKEVVSNFSRRRVVDDYGRVNPKPTAYIGSRSGDYFFKFYNRSAGENECLRWEITARDERAAQAIDTFIKGGFEAVFGDAATRFRLVDSNAGDSCKSRWKTSAEWERYVDGLECKRVKTGFNKSEDIQSKARWFERSCSRTLAELLDHPSYGEQWIAYITKDRRRRSCQPYIDKQLNRRRIGRPIPFIQPKDLG